MRKFVYTIEEIPRIAQELQPFLENYPIITFTGPLGAGKTTLIKELMKGLGIDVDEVTSPTFTYLNLYRLPEKMVYHFDLYRIKQMQDFIDAGFAEYLYQPDSIAIIEWPEVIEPLLKNRVCRIILGYSNNPEERMLTVETK